MNPRTEPPALCPLDAYRLALELIALLAPKMKKLDGDTRRQLRKALNSVVLNTAEDQADSLKGQADGLEDDDHGDQAGFGDAGGADGGEGGGQQPVR